VLVVGSEAARSGTRAPGVVLMGGTLTGWLSRGCSRLVRLLFGGVGTVWVAGGDRGTLLGPEGPCVLWCCALVSVVVSSGVPVGGGRGGVAVGVGVWVPWWVWCRGVVAWLWWGVRGLAGAGSLRCVGAGLRSDGAAPCWSGGWCARRG